MTSLPRIPTAVLALAALGTAGMMAGVPHDRFHPLATQLSLLPLQLGAVIWALGRLRR
ncbi:hypothetical protein [Synechococcus sp. RSCCF101]|uniref:hypothetical protein n=1 Tax=Synechococcus sp. RSCCF101 TaxID=2511069 RepID=UPI0017846CDF|nr:hypothetical protein [Synechococcus sp. RSCCF101]